MATDDQSLASKVENWISTQIQTLAAFDSTNVEYFAGLRAYAGGVGDVVEELRSNRTPWCAISWEGRTSEKMTEGNHDWESTYAIWIVVQNTRDSASRRGDGTTVGTNDLAEKILALFDTEAKRYPAQSANGLYSDSIVMGAFTPIFRPAGISIVQFELRVQESVVDT